MRLLERLVRSVYDYQDMSSDDSDMALVIDDSIRPKYKSIKSHLYRLFNSKKGSSYIAPDYGVWNLEISVRSNDILSIESEFSGLIEKFEKRLKNSRITVSDSGLKGINFEINASIEDNSKSYSISISGFINSSGDVVIN